MGFFHRLFSGEKPEAVDLSLIGADMHSHLIPEIDDGVKSYEESLRIIRKMSELGYKKLITTPHIMSEYYKNNREIIYGGLDLLNREIKKQGIDIVVEAAAEYMYDTGFVKKMEAGDLLTFGDNYVLIELGYYFPPERFFDVIFELKTSGYNPILAHPERYTYWHESPDVYHSIHDREILMQLNLPSLSGFYDPQIKKIAEFLIDHQLIDFVGTDMHNQTYFDQIMKARYSTALKNLVNSGKLKNPSLVG